MLKQIPSGMDCVDFAVSINYVNQIWSNDAVWSVRVIVSIFAAIKQTSFLDAIFIQLLLHHDNNKTNQPRRQKERVRQGNVIDVVNALHCLAKIIPESLGF